MVDRDLDFDDATDSSESEFDSEPSSSSGEGLFKGNIPYILELHDITRDDPAALPGPQPTRTTTTTTTGSTDPLVGPVAAGKIKKHRKKKKKSGSAGTERRGSLSADSASDASSVTPSAKEQFYDAHESFHAIPENEVLAQVSTLPETTIQDPKAPDVAAASESLSTPPVAQKETTAIIKPTAPP